VKAKVLNPPDTIRPGFSVTADIITGRKAGVLTIPLAAEVIRDSPTGERTQTGQLKTQEGVYVVRDGKVHFVQIKTGLAGELSVQVVSGLKEGEEIVTGPFKALRTIKDGDAVVAEKEKKKAGAADDAA